jgi:hypothetical protein
VAVAVAWWLGSTVAGAEPLDRAAPAGGNGPTVPSIDIDLVTGLLPSPFHPSVPGTGVPDVGSPGSPELALPGPLGTTGPDISTIPDLTGLLDAAVPPLPAPGPAPAGVRALAAAAGPVGDVLASVVEPLTWSAAPAPAAAGWSDPAPGPFVGPIVGHEVPPVPHPAPPAAAGFAADASTDASTAAGGGLLPTAGEPAPGPPPAPPAAGAIAPAPIPAAAPAPAPAPDDPRPARAPAPRSVGPADGRAAPVATAPDLPAAPVAGGLAGPAGPADRSGLRPGRQLPSGPSTSGGARDLHDQACGAVVDTVASARAATPAERAPRCAAGVGGSVNAASRPAVTPD